MASPQSACPDHLTSVVGILRAPGVATGSTGSATAFGSVGFTRAKVERKIDHLQDLGMRQNRYRGRRRTRLQSLLAPAVANLKRLAVLGAFDITPELAHAA